MSKPQSYRENARREAERMSAKGSSNTFRNVLILVIAAIIVLLGATVFFIIKETQKTYLTEFDGTAPAVANDQGGIPFGGPDAVAGEENEGTTEIGVYADFLCPACASFDQLHAQDMRDMIESGEATIVYYPVNILDNSGNNTGYSTRAANAFVEVVENQPDKALEFMEVLFMNQPENGDAPDEQIEVIATEVGVDDDVIAQFTDATYADWVATVREQATRDGMTGTPSVSVDRKIQTVEWQNPGALRELVN